MSNSNQLLLVPSRVDSHRYPMYIMAHTALLTTRNGEASPKYQDLIIGLESLERALSRLYTLKPAERALVHLEAIRVAASAYERPLERFLATLENFEKRVGTGKAKGNRYKGVGRRIQFNVAFDEDVKDLRDTLATHIMTIITLLMTQLLCVTSIHNNATVNA